MMDEVSVFSSRKAALRILLVQVELPAWNEARMWSYDSHLGIEEGLAANGIEFHTLTSTWFKYAREICAGKHFDQVWINDIVHLGVHAGITESGLEWLASLAPVRVGFIVESTCYTKAEYETFPGVASYQRMLAQNIQYVTHVAAADEKDVTELPQAWGKPVMWLPIPVPRRCISNKVSRPKVQAALFSGTPYGKRAILLQNPVLKAELVQQVSPENHTLYPFIFDALPMHRYSVGVRWRLGKLVDVLRGVTPSKRPGYARLTASETNTLLPVDLFYSAYLNSLRFIRRKSYTLYLEGLRQGTAVINLPSLFKGYASRVVEGMAAGRPVISWEVPERPRVKALFEDGAEILLYSGDDPLHLASQIHRVLYDPGLCNQLVTNAQRKLKTFHTVEKRVQQILKWIETGEAPTYGI